MKKILSLLAVAAFALTLTACTPKEKHLASGAAIGVAAGAVGAAVINQDPLTGAALGAVAGTAGGYLYDEHRKDEKRKEHWKKHHKKPKHHPHHHPR
jgi:uncharacterized membrane protein